MFKPRPAKARYHLVITTALIYYTSGWDMEDEEITHGSKYCKKGGNVEAWLITKESIEQVDLPALTLNFLDLYVEVHRMPPTLRLFKYRSFGHFILMSRCGKPWNMSMSKL